MSREPSGGASESPNARGSSTAEEGGAWSDKLQDMKLEILQVVRGGLGKAVDQAMGEIGEALLQRPTAEDVRQASHARTTPMASGEASPDRTRDAVCYALQVDVRELVAEVRTLAAALPEVKQVSLELAELRQECQRVRTDVASECQRVRTDVASECERVRTDALELRDVQGIHDSMGTASLRTDLLKVSTSVLEMGSALKELRDSSSAALAATSTQATLLAAVEDVGKQNFVQVEVLEGLRLVREDLDSLAQSMAERSHLTQKMNELVGQWYGSTMEALGGLQGGGARSLEILQASELEDRKLKGQLDRMLEAVEDMGKQNWAQAEAARKAEEERRAQEAQHAKVLGAMGFQTDKMMLVQAWKAWHLEWARAADAKAHERQVAELREEMERCKQAARKAEEDRRAQEAAEAARRAEEETERRARGLADRQKAQQAKVLGAMGFQMDKMMLVEAWKAWHLEWARAVDAKAHERQVAELREEMERPKQAVAALEARDGKADLAAVQGDLAKVHLQLQTFAPFRQELEKALADFKLAREVAAQDSSRLITEVRKVTACLCDREGRPLGEPLEVRDPFAVKADLAPVLKEIEALKVMARGGGPGIANDPDLSQVFGDLHASLANVSTHDGSADDFDEPCFVRVHDFK